MISDEEIVAQLATLPFDILPPQPEKSVVAIPPPGNGAGNWVGAPSAIRHGGQIFLTYRLRRPIGQGRGYQVGVGAHAGHVGGAGFGIDRQNTPQSGSVQTSCLAFGAGAEQI